MSGGLGVDSRRAQLGAAIWRDIRNFVVASSGVPLASPLLVSQEALEGTHGRYGIVLCMSRIHGLPKQLTSRNVPQPALCWPLSRDMRHLGFGGGGEIGMVDATLRTWRTKGESKPSLYACILQDCPVLSCPPQLSRESMCMWLHGKWPG